MPDTAFSIWLGVREYLDIGRQSPDAADLQAAAEIARRQPNTVSLRQAMTEYLRNPHHRDSRLPAFAGEFKKSHPAAVIAVAPVVKETASPKAAILPPTPAPSAAAIPPPATPPVKPAPAPAKTVAPAKPAPEAKAKRKLTPKPKAARKRPAVPTSPPAAPEGEEQQALPGANLALVRGLAAEQKRLGNCGSRIGLALARRMGPDGKCNPGNDDLRALSGLRKPKSIAKGIRALVAAGLIVAKRRKRDYTLFTLGPRVAPEGHFLNAKICPKRGIEICPKRGGNYSIAITTTTTVLPERFQTDARFMERWPDLAAKAAAAFPAVDLGAELLKADGWLAATGTKRKDLGRFAWNWFARAASPRTSRHDAGGDGLTQAQRAELEARQAAAEAAFEKATAPGGFLSEGAAL